MSRRRRLSSRAALGILGGGTLLLVGGCAYIIDFDAYSFGDEASSSGSGSVGASAASVGSGAASTGSGGADAGSCDLADSKCRIEVVMKEQFDGHEYGDISLGDGYIYWIDTGGISQISKSALEKTPNKLTSLGVIAITAVRDDYLYFLSLKAGATGYYDITKLKISDKSTQSVSFDKTTSLTVLSDFVYWASTGDSKMHKGQAPDMPESLPDTDTGLMPALLASNGVQVFWTYQGSGGMDGGVKKLENEMSKEVDKEIIGAQDGPSGIAVDNTYVYWLNRDAALHKAAAADGSGHVQSKGWAKLQGFSGRVAVSGTHVYWTGPDETTCTAASNCDCGTLCGVVMTAPVNDLTNPTPFASGGWKRIHGLAADGDHVFWTADTAEEHLLLRKEALP